MKDYDLITCIAKRSGSEIWKAAEKKSGRYVALKFMRSGAQRVSFQEDIIPEKEFRALINLSHKNIAAIQNIGRDEDGAPFIAMEFVEGKTLADLIRNKVPIPFSKWLDIMVQTAEGLRHASLNNIVHRDIKPSNIMLTSDGVVKIVDFGLARFLVPFQDLLFGADFGNVRESAGTPAYMSPEQCQGKTTDHRSDIYSLGAAFYHCFAGRPPFEGATDFEIMEKQKCAPLVPLYLANPKVPQELSRVIEKMMEKDSDSRYQHYEEMIQEFREIQLICLSREKGAAKPQKSAEADAALHDREKHGKDAPFLRPIHLAAFIVVLIMIYILLYSILPRTEARPRRKRNKIIHLMEKVAPKVESAIQPLSGAAKDAPSSLVKSGNAQKELDSAFEKVAASIGLFQKNIGSVPSSLDELEEQKILDKSEILDPWGSPLRWLAQTRQLASDGPDKTPDTADDIKKDVP